MSPVDSGSGAIKGLVEFIVKCESPIEAGGGDVKCPYAYSTYSCGTYSNAVQLASC